MNLDTFRRHCMPSWTISEGVITGFLLSPASTEDHRAAEAFLCWRANPLDAPLTPDEMPCRRNGKLHAGPNGPQWPRYGPGEASGAACYLGDNGFSGQDWQPRRAEDCGAEALAPRNYSGETGEHRRRWLRSQLQVIESVNGVLTGVFHLGVSLGAEPGLAADPASSQSAGLQPGPVAEPALRAPGFVLRRSLQLLMCIKRLKGRGRVNSPTT